MASDASAYPAAPWQLAGPAVAVAVPASRAVERARRDGLYGAAFVQLRARQPR